MSIKSQFNVHQWTIQLDPDPYVKLGHVFLFQDVYLIISFSLSDVSSYGLLTFLASVSTSKVK